MLVYLLVLLLTLLVYYGLIKRWKYWHIAAPAIFIPPFGHIELMIKPADPIGNFMTLYKKYARKGMFMTNMFGMDNLFVGDYDTLKYLYSHPQVQNRGHTSLSKHVFHQKLSVDRGWDPLQPSRGVIFSQGRHWIEQRRTTLKTLRDFGFGRLSMEETIQEEVRKFLSYLRSTNGEPVDLAGKFNMPVLNVLWKVCVGHSFEYDDPKLKEIMNLMHQFFKEIGNPISILHITIPWLFKIFPTLLNRHVAVVLNTKINSLMADHVIEHEETLDENNPRDYIDTILIEIKKTIDPLSSFYGDVGKENLINTLNDLFLAGAETSSTTLTWGMLYMVRHPEVQKKVQEELDEVVGRSRCPSLTDRADLPYTEAVIMEIQRCGNIIPMGVSHFNAVPIEVNGITLPANTNINPLLAVLLKGDYWGDGTSFRPERFLDQEGKLKSDEHLIPFSIGKRRCLGETLAKTELFSFFTGILHEFSLHPEDLNKIPEDNYSMGATILPKPFKIIIKPRN